MKIGLISDTHGDVVQVIKALDILKDCEYIIHTGDVLYHGPRNPLPNNYNPKELAELLSTRNNIIYIKGNCDSDVDEMVIGQDLSQKNRLIEFGERRIYAVHGYEENEEERISKAKELGANIIISGHTHVKVLKIVENLLIINPGSTTLPKDDSASIAKIEEDNAYLIDLENGKIISKISF